MNPKTFLTLIILKYSFILMFDVIYLFILTPIPLQCKQRAQHFRFLKIQSSFTWTQVHKIFDITLRQNTINLILKGMSRPSVAFISFHICMAFLHQNLNLKTNIQYCEFIYYFIWILILALWLTLSLYPTIVSSSLTWALIYFYFQFSFSFQ